MHLSRYIPFWSRRLEQRAAIVCEGETLTWAELDRASASLAAFLRASGIGPGDRIGCLLGNSIPWCVAFYASLRLGAIFVPLNALFGPFELMQIAASAELSAILSSPRLIAKADAGFPSANDDTPTLYLLPVRASVPFAQTVAGLGEWADPDFDDADVLAICYTSGTTGVPKGAMLTHRAVETASQGIILNCGLRGGDERFLILAPLAFAGGVISNLAPLLVVGGTGYLEKSVDPARALDLLIRHRLTGLGGVPALWERIAQAPGFAAADLTELRMAVTGGASVPRALLDTWLAKGVAIRQQYGFTEACGGVASPDAAGAVRNPAACGFAMPAMEVEISDEAGTRVAAGEVGEIRVRGPQLMRGYWRAPEETAAAFDGDWYRTGDLGTYEEDGAIRVVDRKKNMIISGGVNVYPAEVERALYTIDGVEEALVFGVASDRWTEEVAALVHAPGRGDGAAIAAECRALVGPYKAPKHLVLSPAPLARTASGKLARTGMREVFDALAAGARAVAAG